MLNFTSEIFKNFTRKKATRDYPRVKREPFPKARGRIGINIDECILCSICAKKCPSSCIAVDKKSGQWELDPMACVYCGICVQVCPTQCLIHENQPNFPVHDKFLQQHSRPPIVKSSKNK
ncbi:4Fe-4S binding protein [Desulfonatronovibrio magnus]|uniref:4Fe-4S binding protein n=1 Tax=Desulfonatronovibrio magnus TaxID=698827 RepID=UPI000698B173|nr:4Fe-4S binding protein [Desulfonatronovibrio magnus]